MLSLVVDQGVAEKGLGPAVTQADAKDAEAIARVAKKGSDMPKIRIDVYEDGTRAATITVPTWLVTGASRLLPKVGGRSLQDHVDINQLVELLKNPPASGVLLEVEDHKSRERLVISSSARRRWALEVIAGTNPAGSECCASLAWYPGCHGRACPDHPSNRLLRRPWRAGSSGQAGQARG
jgi:hypothetical protein